MGLHTESGAGYHPHQCACSSDNASAGSSSDVPFWGGQIRSNGPPALESQRLTSLGMLQSIPRYSLRNSHLLVTAAISLLQKHLKDHLLTMICIWGIYE